MSKRMHAGQREFEAALDRWGPDFERWPPAAATAARDHLTRSADARRALAAAQAVDAHLLGLREHAAPPGLAARIVARGAAGDHPGDVVERALGWLAGNHWRPAMLGLLVAAAGYLTGVLAADPIDADLAADVESLAFSDLYAEIDDAQ